MNVEVAITTSNGKTMSCVVPTLQQATGLVSLLVSKGYGVFTQNTSQPVTHRNTFVAQLYLEGVEEYKGQKAS